MNKIKGDNYELFILNKLKQSYDYVWLWKDIPEHILFEEKIIIDYNVYSLYRNDIGIDILAKKDNNYIYVQCKNYTNTICIENIAGYLFFKDNYKDKKCYVYYSGTLSNPIKHFYNNKNEFINVPYINEIINSIGANNCNIIESRAYQIEAYDMLKNKNRSILNLPCGMGKTYTSYLLAKDYDNVIFFAPTKELCLQTLNVYKNYLKLYNHILISSDGTRNLSNIKLKNKNVIISTFKSCDVVNKIIKKINDPYIIIDEFHNLSANDILNKNNEFYKILHSKYKILYLSATPKFIDNTQIFGNTIFRYNWNTAIKNNYINDFEIVLPSRDYISIEFERFTNLFKINNNQNYDAKIIRQLYFLVRSILFNGNKKCIIYLTDVDKAQKCSKILDWMMQLFNVELIKGIIDYKTSKNERSRIIKNFEESDSINIILNVHIMDEGINIPICDSVYILKPNNNIDNIIQRMSRCNRKCDNKNKSSIYLWCSEKKVKKILDYINDKSEGEFNEKIRWTNLELTQIVNSKKIDKDCNTINYPSHLDNYCVYDNTSNILNNIDITYGDEELKLFNILYSEGPSSTVIAKLIYSINKGKLIYDAVNYVWFIINNNGIYVGINEELIVENQLQAELINTINIFFKKNIINGISKHNNHLLLTNYCKKKSNISIILNELKFIYKSQNIYKIMNTKNLIGFNNGAYDLDKNIFRNINLGDFVSITTGYDYKKGNENMKNDLLMLLNSFFLNIEELKYVLKQMSLGLCGAQKRDLYIWIGDNENLQFLNKLMQNTLGKYYESVDESYFKRNNIIKKDLPDDTIIKIINSRFISTNFKNNEIYKMSTIASLISDKQLETKLYYKNIKINYVQKFQLVVLANNEPKFDTFDIELKNIIKIIKIMGKSKIPLDIQKIINDKQYINEFFDILVDHYNLYLREGLKLPKRFEDDTNKFIENNFPIGKWLESNVNITNNKKDCVKSSELYDDFINFMDNDTRGITTLLFKNTLTSIGIQHKKKNIGQFYVGIKLKNN